MRLLTKLAAVVSMCFLMTLAPSAEAAYCTLNGVRQSVSIKKSDPADVRIRIGAGKREGAHLNEWQAFVVQNGVVKVKTPARWSIPSWYEDISWSSTILISAKLLPEAPYEIHLYNHLGDKDNEQSCIFIVREDGKVKKLRVNK